MCDKKIKRTKPPIYFDTHNANIGFASYAGLKFRPEEKGD